MAANASSCGVIFKGVGRAEINSFRSETHNCCSCKDGISITGMAFEEKADPPMVSCKSQQGIKFSHKDEQLPCPEKNLRYEWEKVDFYWISWELNFMPCNDSTHITTKRHISNSWNAFHPSTLLNMLLNNENIWIRILPFFKVVELRWNKYAFEFASLITANATEDLLVWAGHFVLVKQYPTPKFPAPLPS